MHKLTFAPTSYIGWGCLSVLPDEVKRLQAKKILIVTDPFLLKLGITDTIEKPLQQMGCTTDIYTDVEPEPPLEIGERLVAYTRSHEFDLVIGLGGGSALDLAKIAAVLSMNDGNVSDYLNLSGNRTITDKGLPKILIPTTSGTGSEVTNISVLSLDTTKDVVTHDFLLADVAIVDPELTITLPPKVTAATGVDALTHAIEAYVSKNANPITDSLAFKAIQLISGAIRTAVKDGENKQARSDMSYGSYLAGLAFFNAGVAGVHALAYPLGGQFHIAHGDSNAVLLPYVMGYIRISCEEQLKHILEAMGSSTVGQTQEEASYTCINKLEELVNDVGIPSTLKGFNIPIESLEALTDDAIKQTRILARSPMELKRDDIFAIYKSAFEGVVVEPH
ncbi:iron-containing alcohol dehydrogenase [Sporosarcina sp. P17b]|uniref:iron-containing alcohol dehydrogenase n=1 Tax=Sporosarcina sp. P17b TaxID=2048260 RepID=UPI000C17175B|nr:iron-containing alcohol dehydrogenase [Sporosarcina sp. P17b]PIC74884.1 alcohol dehydrogenase [Sporosarcina sp. P17b]